MLSHGIADLDLPLTDLFLSLSNPIFIPYHDFSSTIVHRLPNTIDDHPNQAFDEIFNRIIHPYDTDAFEFFLTKHDLKIPYSLLVANLRNGFPLGEMPPLLDTVIFKNHPSALEHPEVVEKYLTEETDAGRMSGPFSNQHVAKTLRGHFFSSPLLVSVQIQSPGTADKLRVCRHLSKGDKANPSANSYVNKEDFPTRFDTASKVADIVSSSTISGWHPPLLLFTLWDPLLVILFLPYL